MERQVNIMKNLKQITEKITGSVAFWVVALMSAMAVFVQVFLSMASH